MGEFVKYSSLSLRLNSVQYGQIGSFGGILGSNSNYESRVSLILSVPLSIDSEYFK